VIQACILLYVDPGSGSYLIQVLIAAIVGALFYFKNLWWKVKAFFWKPKKEDTTEGEDIVK
jgi:hypothetical protein